MTVFVTWLKSRRAEPSRWLVFVGAALLAACSQPKPGEGDQASQLTPTKPAPAQPAPTKASPATGLTPLPTANQVLASVSTGRADPFAPQALPDGPQPGRSRSVAPKPLTLPDGFVFSGVIRSGSRPQALVQIGDQTGPICQGPRGACPGSGFEALLPPGWIVAAIDVDRGRLTLRQGKQSITAEL